MVSSDMISLRAFTGATPNAAKLISGHIQLKILYFLLKGLLIVYDQRSALGQTKQDNAKIPRDDPQMRGVIPPYLNRLNQKEGRFLL